MSITLSKTRTNTLNYETFSVFNIICSLRLSKANWDIALNKFVYFS